MLIRISEGNAPQSLHGGIFTPTIMDFEELHTVTSALPYSSMTYKSEVSNGTNRRGSNVEEIGNVLIYDIDNGLTLSDAIATAEAYKSLIVTSRNHQKDKKGVVCDRYRLIIPLYSNTSLSLAIPKEDYPTFYIFTAQYLGFDCIDKATKDIARFYYPNLEQIVNYSQSDEVLEFETLYGEYLKHKRLSTAQKQHFKVLQQYGVLKNRLSKNELPLNQTFETRNGMMIGWDAATAKSLPVKCIFTENHKHGDRNPSAFIIHDAGAKNPRFYCSGCNASYWMGAI